MRLLSLFIVPIGLTIASCTSIARIKDAIPKHDSLVIYSHALAENRTINVWTPPSYTATNQTLPVLYMADGGIGEDFPHLANTLDKLIKEGRIRPLILVGIENTQRRRDLTGTTEVETDKQIAPVVGGSSVFRTFVRDELIPEINKRYKTSDVRGIIGESLAGLFVVETFFLSPDLFNHYIAFDPSLWWNNHAMIQAIAKDTLHFPTQPMRLWFAASNAQDISVYTRELADICKVRDLPNLQWHYSDEPKLTHASIFRATKEKALIWMFGGIQ